jgi:putative nucleotidyltransferase with HDIG domain
LDRATAAVGETLEKIFAQGTPLLVGTAEGYLVVGDQPFLDPTPQSQALMSWLEQKGVEAVVFQSQAEPGDVASFCRWLRSDTPDPWRGGTIAVTRLDREGTVWDKGLRVYREALGALEEAYREAEAGRTPDPARVRQTVGTFVDLATENPSVARGLTLLKDYDRYTFHHSVNVCLHALSLGRHIGLASADLMGLGLGGLFHDIGKTRTPPEIVRKPTKLSRSEWSEIWRHPEYGRDILHDMENVSTATSRVVYEHHMQFDGGGYPTRPSGYSIDPLSPFVTVADVYDAMTSHRPYRAPSPLPDAVSAMVGLRGSHFAPEALDAFLAVVGPVPVGSVVRLATGEVGVVTGVNGGEVFQVRTVLGPKGERKAVSDSRPREVGRGEIAGCVDPLAHGIDAFKVLRGES